MTARAQVERAVWALLLAGVKPEDISAEPSGHFITARGHRVFQLICPGFRDGAPDAWSGEWRTAELVKADLTHLAEFVAVSGWPRITKPLSDHLKEWSALT